MTDAIVKADIFFVVTTIAVIAIALVLCWLMVYLIRILRDVKDISGRVNKESKAVVDELDAFRLQVKTNGLQL